MDYAVIRIRYRDLSPGLHGKAEPSARGVTVYLLPGLTGRQREAALRRLRQEASRGCGPALPLPQLTVALALDRVRSAFRRTAAVVRLHPAGRLLPTAAAGALMTLFVLASVSVRIAHVPQAVPDSTPVGSDFSGVPTAVGHAVRVGGPVSAAPGAVSVAAGAVSAAPGAGVGALGGSGGGQGKTSWSLVTSSGAGTGGTGLGAWARSGSGAVSGSGAGSGSTSGSGSGPGWGAGSWPGCGSGSSCDAGAGVGYVSG